MLSYRHGYHAGNPADILKHTTLILLLEALGQKDKPYAVIDSHAGAGLYDLFGEWAQKNGEYRQGISLLWAHKDRFPELSSFWELMDSLNPSSQLRYYPGSPEIIRHKLRPQDRLAAFELHSSEVETLKAHFFRDSRVGIHHRDAFEGTLALLPPPERRGLVLIDPSYEVKEDYDKVADLLRKASKKWETGIFALWYPLLGREVDRGDWLMETLRRHPFKSLLDIRLETQEQSEDWGMYGSGMAIINAPWQLDKKMADLGPRLGEVLNARFSLTWEVAPA